jgi:hypothetical protein
MIPASRFIATSDDRPVWLAARTGAVTATEVARAATPAGFLLAAEERRNPQPVEDNAYMKFGRDNEQWLALDLKAKFGIMPNHWLIAAESNPMHMATPDGLSLDHTAIAEIKTGGKAEYVKPPIQYRRQIQWQLWCTGAEWCAYAFMHRIEVGGVFVPAWLEPKTLRIERDDAMISQLVTVADRLLDIDTEQRFAA